MEQSGEDDDDTLTLRDTDKLHASIVTINCARRLSCVPCAYKIGGFHSSWDNIFTRVCPNRRPEECPRARNDDGRNQLPGFSEGMNVLTLGDGDFSFSLGLARQICSSTTKDNGQGRRSFLVATSYEKESTLVEVYGKTFRQTVEELKSLGVYLAYEVDATALAETLPSSLLVETDTAEGIESKQRLRRKFHRICWNFPCTAIAEGQDGQNQQMQDNQRLIRGFVAASRPLLARACGEVHICHKTKPPYNQWKLEEQVALGIKKQNEGEHKLQPASSIPLPDLKYAGRIVLDRFLIKPYTPRKALDRKSFPCHDACFYVFAAADDTLNTGGKTTKKERLECSFPPTIPIDVDNDEIYEHQRPQCSKDLVRVDKKLILSIRQYHLERAHERDKQQEAHGGDDISSSKKRKTFSSNTVTPFVRPQNSTKKTKKNKRRR